MGFERLLADFGDATGIDLSPDSQGSAWCEADGVVVTLQHRPEHDDVVIFTLPCGEMPADEAMMRHALELSSAGIGTGGFFIGLYDGYLTLSAVLPLEGAGREPLHRREVPRPQGRTDWRAEQIVQHERKRRARTWPQSGREPLRNPCRRRRPQDRRVIGARDTIRIPLCG